MTSYRPYTHLCVMCKPTPHCMTLDNVVSIYLVMQTVCGRNIPRHVPRATFITPPKKEKSVETTAIITIKSKYMLFVITCEQLHTCQRVVTCGNRRRKQWTNMEIMLPSLQMYFSKNNSWHTDRSQYRLADFVIVSTSECQHKRIYKTSSSLWRAYSVKPGFKYVFQGLQAECISFRMCATKEPRHQIWC